MTEQEIRAQFPEIVASIEAAAANTARTEAVAAERARLQEIESIEAQIGDSDLIKEAKYGEGACNAATLALKAMQKQAAQGASFITGLNNDAKKSGTAGVTGDPNGGNADDGNDDEAEFAGIVNAYKATRGGKN